jgi:hypothetical protein
MRIPPCFLSSTTTTTRTAANMALLPPPLSLRLPAAQPPRMHAHLLPLRIEYDGPAPVSRYFLVQPEAASSSNSTANGASATAAAGESSPLAPRTYEAAFRGRALHGTALEVAPLRLFLCDVPSSSSAAPAASAPVKRAKVAAAPPAPAPSDEGLRRSPRKRAMPPPPPAKKKGAKMQVFSMDSDSDGEPADEEQDLGWGDEEAPGSRASLPPEAPAEEQLAAPPEQREQGRTMRVQATADELILWAPDGPLDTGDDVYWRTLCEWRGVRQGLMQWP